MPQLQRITRNNTAVIVKGQKGVAADYISVVLHATKVVEATPLAVTLDSGGWRTATTKTRMNQAANQFRLGYSVFARGGKWFVRLNHDGSEHEFYDGFSLARL